MSSTVSLINVLVVNDQREMCELWQRIIDLTPGMSCPDYALNGEAALRKVEALKPDVILMDVMMPGIGGVEATKQIRLAHPQTLVIMYSAYAGTEEIAFDAGAHAYLLMPIPPERLTQTIRRIFKENRL